MRPDSRRASRERRSNLPRPRLPLASFLMKSRPFLPSENSTSQPGMSPVRSRNSWGIVTRPLEVIVIVRVPGSRTPTRKKSTLRAVGRNDRLVRRSRIEATGGQPPNHAWKSRGRRGLPDSRRRGRRSSACHRPRFETRFPRGRRWGLDRGGRGLSRSAPCRPGFSRFNWRAWDAHGFARVAASGVSVRHAHRGGVLGTAPLRVSKRAGGGRIGLFLEA